VGNNEKSIPSVDDTLVTEGIFKPVKTAIAFSGGGAKGDFQLGAAKYLYERKIKQPDIICGTSVGSVNAAKLAESTSTSPMELEEM
jgi:predicted acylesterase/phospholipase RssA